MGLCLLSAGPALAEGFALRDLSGLGPAAGAALGGGYLHRAAPDRVTLTCPDCAGAPMIDILIGRQTDGTEARVRSGETPIAQLERLCQAREPRCRLGPLAAAPAIGWLSTYPIGATAGATAILLREGDMLTIRSVAGTPEIARGNAERLVEEMRRVVVGE